MAELREKLESSKPWEILATFFGYFAVAGDVPEILRTLNLSKLIPNVIKTYFLKWNPDSDFWFLLFFTGSTVLLWLWLIPRKKEVKENKDKEREDIIREIATTMRRKNIIRIVRSFGLVFLREFLLSRLLKVSFYGTFKRPPPPNWPPAPDRFKSVDRISFSDGTGIEFQYSRDFENLISRKHPKGSDQFGAEEQRKPSWDDIKLLLIASNIFPFWHVMFLLNKSLQFLKRKIVCHG